jgi:hypothetical protein
MSDKIVLATITFFAVAMPLAFFSPILFPQLFFPEHCDKNITLDAKCRHTCTSMTNAW